jgi:hypothetical protein
LATAHPLADESPQEELKVRPRNGRLTP